MCSLLIGIHIIEGTLKACKQRRYPYGPTDDAVSLCDSLDVMTKQAQDTVLHDLSTRYDLSPENTNYHNDANQEEGEDVDDEGDHGDDETAKEAFTTVFEVKNADCLEEALRLKQELNFNPVVLNMASAKRPGGGTLRFSLLPVLVVNNPWGQVTRMELERRRKICFEGPIWRTCSLILRAWIENASGTIHCQNSAPFTRPERLCFDHRRLLATPSCPSLLKWRLLLSLLTPTPRQIRRRTAPFG